MSTIACTFTTGLIIAVAAVLGVSGWRVCGRYGERCEQAGRFFPIRDAATGRIVVVMHDVNGNGVVDTWVHRGEAGIDEIEVDRDEDGTMDEVLSPDQHGVLRLADVRARKLTKEQ